MEGPSTEKLITNYNQVIEWIFSQTQNSSERVRCSVASLLAKMAQCCPGIFVSSEEILGKLYQWFQQTIQSNQHPRIVLFSLQTISNLFVELHKDQTNIGLMNNQFSEIIQLAIQVVINERFIQEGHSQIAQDCINDICQHCDSKGLQSLLISLIQNVLQLISGQILNNSTFTPMQVESLVNNFGGMLQVLVVMIGKDALTDELIAELFNTLTIICNRDECRIGSLLIINGLLNTMNEAQIKNVGEPVFEIISSTINDDSGKFDVICKRNAAGLTQDLAVGLGEQVVLYIEKMMNLLSIILQDDHQPTDLKTIAVKAIGDICLMCEQAFAPYLDQTMQVLIQAAHMTAEEINPSIPIEDQKLIHDLREALIDAFISIINGIKSPHDGSSMVDHQHLDGHIKNMFFYLEKLMTLKDLSINGEIAKQIIDMYSDIVILQMNEVEGMGDQRRRDAQEFSSFVRGSSLHINIKDRLGPFIEQINELDQGEAVERFQAVVGNKVNI